MCHLPKYSSNYINNRQSTEDYPDWVAIDRIVHASKNVKENSQKLKKTSKYTISLKGLKSKHIAVFLSFFDIFSLMETFETNISNNDSSLEIIWNQLYNSIEN